MRHVRLGNTLAAAFLAALVGCSSARTLEEASTVPECARCHGFPPSAETGDANHPVVASEATACSACHSKTVAASGEIIPGGAHQNGQVDVTVSHPIPYVAQHPPEALKNIESCKACHGNDYNGGSAPSCTACHAKAPPDGPGISSWTQNCTFCHGTRTDGVTTATNLAAPPESVDGEGDQTNANPKVGAHQAHLTPGTYAAALPCSSCHQVPTTDQALTHYQGTGAQAEITFSPLAQQGVTGAAYDRTSCAVYCHGSGTSWPTGSVAANRTPAWTSTGLACTACHASRPSTGRHTNIGAHNGSVCANCHLGYAQGTTIDPAFHVDGSRTVRFPTRNGNGAITTLTNPGWTDCSICHGANGNANAPLL
jgi:predicted CxxxxCH...CXXCH cytochrome family protein